MSHPTIRRFEALLTEHAPDYLETLNPPAGDQTLSEATEALQGLGEVWLELHAWRDGASDWSALWQGLEFLSLESSARIKQTMDELEADGTFDKWAPNEWWNPGWVPIFDNRSYDTYVIDTEGCHGGEPGQILRWSKDGPGRPAIAPSFGAWLEVFCDLVEEGELSWDPDEGGFCSKGHHMVDELISARFDGYPRRGAARTRHSLGMKRTPKPVENLETTAGFELEVTHQVWAPGEASIACIEWIEELGLLAVGQSAFGDASFPALSLVDPETGDVDEEIAPAGAGTMGIRWLPERRELVYLLNAAGREIWVWNAETSERRNLVGDFWETRMHDAFDAGGDYALHAGESVRIYDLDTGTVRRVPVTPGGEVSAALSPDGQRVAAHLPGGPLRIFRFPPGDGPLKLVDEWPVESEKFSSLCFDRAGEVLTGIEWYSNAVERFGPDGSPIGIEDPPNSPFVIADAGREGLWAATGYTGRVNVFDAEGRQLSSDDAHRFARVYGLAFDRAGRRLFSGGQDGQIATRALG
jgi:cell wall assembly regulator SMI1/sugar lactone lactonase YvrE